LPRNSGIDRDSLAKKIITVNLDVIFIPN